MSDTGNNSGGGDNVTAKRDPELPPDATWLKKPSDIKFLAIEETNFEDETDFFFTGLQAASDSKMAIRRLKMLCLFMVSHVKYKPSPNSYAKSAANNGSKDGNIERIIWLIDVFGITGYNMAAIILQRGQSDSILFGLDRCMRNSEDAGKS